MIPTTKDRAYWESLIPTGSGLRYSASDESGRTVTTSLAQSNLELDLGWFDDADWAMRIEISTSRESTNADTIRIANSPKSAMGIVVAFLDDNFAYTIQADSALERLEICGVVAEPKEWGSGVNTGPRIHLEASKIEFLSISNAAVEAQALKLGNLSLSDSLMLIRQGATFAERLRSDIEALRLAGQCGIVGEGRNLRLSTVEFEDGAVLEIESLTIQSTRFECMGKEATATIGSLTAETANYEVERITNCKLSLTRRASLVIGKACADVEISGTGSSFLLFKEGVDAQRIKLAGARLHVEREAVLADVSGSSTIITLKDAHLIGSPSAGFTIDTVEVSTKYSDPLSGATLRDVDFPFPGGRNSLRFVEASSHFSPHLSRLPVGTLKYRRPFALGIVDRPRFQFADLVNQAEFIRELSALATSKGAPGSVRTSLAWASYRMQNLVAISRTERSILSAYRLIGYGERSIPAILAWLALSFVVIPIGGSLELDISWDGVGRLLDLWWSYVLSPLYLLNLAGRAEQLGERELVARILVALPFVTAVLAARKYVKADKGSTEKS